MLGRTRLYQNTRSPLIHGLSGARRRPWWPWVVGALLLLAAAWVYLTYVH